MDQFRDKARLAGEGDTISEGSGSSKEEGSSYLYEVRPDGTRVVLGRSIASWNKLIFFYLLFTAILALLWGLCMGVFFQTLDFYIPKYSQESSAGVLSANPGLGFRPAGGLGFVNKNGEDSDPSIYSSLIWFRHGANGNWQSLKQNLDVFLKQYEPGFFANQGASLTKCSFETDPLSSNTRGAKDKSCEFNKEWLSNPESDYKCISEEDYGYRHGKPCILLKMNKIYNWKPVPYTMEQVNASTTMPVKLKEDIAKIWEDKCAPENYPYSGYVDLNSNGFYDQGEGQPCPWMNMAWLHCDGEDYADMENIGPVTYTPFRGFPGYFYPYRNQRGYLSPIVMVQLDQPEPGVLMNLECTVWAQNIEHNRLKRRGLTHFELIMD